MENTNVTLVKIVGEKDNSNFKTEFFRVYKVETILMAPLKDCKLILKDGSVFYINKIEQNIQKCVVYLYEFTWIYYRKFHSNKKEFEKLKEKLIRDGWSDKDKHKIIRGEFK